MNTRLRKKALPCVRCPWAVSLRAIVLGAAFVLAAAGCSEGDPDVARVVGEGTASYYGVKSAGNATANGEVFDPAQLTAAHRTLPMDSRVRVTNLRNDSSVVVRINDRGPFHADRIIDLSRRAAERIGMLAHGQVRVKVELLEEE